ncbi:MAG TPA: ABC transporter permease [Vicinamibacterales bacterium]|jgi:NitT/TauT family transport system permease protein|nr:ABC transporter permease [Vicinamibacterales bacterium]
MNQVSATRRWETVFWPAVTAGVILVFWAASIRLMHATIFPSPLAVATGAGQLVQGGLYFKYIADSLRRVTSGYLIAVGLGIPFGLVLGWYPIAGQIVNPTIQILRPISPIAWIPIAILLFGVGDMASIYLVFIASFFPIVVSTMNGVRNVPQMYRRAGRNFGLSPGNLLRQVVFPAALPQMLVGLRIALGIAWLVVVAAEMIASDSGLGYLVIDARNSGKRYDLVVAAMITIGVIGLMLDFLLRRLETLKTVRWGFRNAS